jgi:hypothetical protein
VTLLSGSTINSDEYIRIIQGKLPKGGMPNQQT